MSLDLKAIAGSAYDLAKGIAPQAFRTATIYLGPTQGAYDPATDASATTWAQTVAGVSVLKYEDADERVDQAVEAKMCVFLVDMNDLTDSEAQIQQDGKIVESGLSWEIYRAETDPSRSVVKFFCRR